ncbi:PREDICTED: proline-, glutamic acid- and leucine-rich protein 1 isoform X1 [Lupinus angustifolius]|uniref:proline-, glutamic acid- and leucine-rich protein 1 isoform X1 n=1 Tax=Lupinus angustifolius TaxID=3871 RepID=UPI00092F17B1|nr:PREDICTED: proline-, glutamic acid- and leucine-rich protein 1 isoform X1 [Lupinus angustifolius]
MSTFDCFSNMYDVALKPRLLRTLIRDHVPDEKHPFSNTLEISRVISLVKTHRLLSESVNQFVDPKVVEAWKSNVTSWVERILSLLSSNSPDKCWVGISLLGVTCTECSSDRFLESYSVWFQKLLSFLQSTEGSHLVRVASCASMSDLFGRLTVFPKLKKDASSCAVKVIQPVLKMLHDDYSELIWEGALHLLCTMITSFPFSIQRHYDSIESAIGLKLLSGGCSRSMLKKLAHCLALLPKSRGDEESWTVLMQKILIAINDHLNFAFQGLEEETMRKVVTGLLVPPGRQPPPPLAGFILAEEVTNKAIKRSEQLLMSNVSALMFGCCTMLTESYPVKINVPARLLLALVERILMVDGSLPQMSLPFMTAIQQENICSELPVLHLCSLELLTTITKVLGRQILPHAASILRIITMYFKTCALPELRIKVYSAARILLMSVGVGMASCLAQEIVNNASADLSNIEKSGGTVNGLNSNASTGAPLLPSHRKRKHSSTTSSLQEHDEGGGLGVEYPKNRLLTPISLRIAALEALEALITVAGALRSERWRSQVDNLLIVVAIDSFKEGSAIEEIGLFLLNEPAATATDLQLAALHALLASFLSFNRVRPPYLAQGLKLFHRGKQQTGTKLAEFCAHALLTLEVLIHPRALPLGDYNHTFGEAQRNLPDEYTWRNNSTTFGLPQVGNDTLNTDDDLFARWMGNDNEVDVPLAKNTKYTEDASEVATFPDAEMTAVEDENILNSDQPGDSAVQFQEPISFTTSIPVAEARDSVATTKIVSERIVSDGTMPDSEDNHMESGRGISVNKAFQSSPLQTTEGSTIVHEYALTLNHGSSLDNEDPFPDIVDEDPDDSGSEEA